MLKVDMARLRGDNFKRKIREKTLAFFGKAIKKLIPIDNYALADILDDALEKGLISDQEREFAIKLGFAGKGRLRDKNAYVYIALGATLSLYSEDVEKAFKRAEILSRAVYTETIPVVVYLIAAEEALKRAGVLRFLAVKTIAED
ncbi:MAG: hypothetical protein N3D14_05155 [Aquificaceae bacterium]|nr:hypothetical protein [Aquificaceae bacterium]